MEKIEDMNVETDQVVDIIEDDEGTTGGTSLEQLTTPNVGKTESSRTSNFDSLFDSLYNDVAGANKFITNLIDQKKNVNLTESTLAEDRQKFEQEKAEFNKFMQSQKESIDLEKARLDEYERNQKVRLEAEQKAFNEEVEATKNEFTLADQTLKNNTEKLQNERNQFAKYRDAEQEKIVLANDKIALEREQFEKYKEVEEERILTAKNKNETDRAQLERENINALERVRLAEANLEEQKEQFEKYKEVEKKKLELESKNLSQSCARFKELVSQFNSGFTQLPDRD